MTAQQKPKVLIIDDERKNRDLLEVILSDQGYDVVMADCGEDAFRLVADGPPDIVLLDVMMPGMDGYQVATRLKADPRTMHIPVVMLSALTDRNSVMHGLAAGADVYLGKPVDSAELRLQIRNLLRLTGQD